MRRALVVLSVAAYRLFLRTYPGSYRRRFAGPMLRVFREMCAEQVTGPRSAARLWRRELSSLLSRGLRERLGRAGGGSRVAGAPPGGPSDTYSTGGRTAMTSPAAWLDTLAQDGRHAVRVLWNRPTYTVVVIATLTLAIGMNTAIFSVLYGVLLQPLPFEGSEKLVRIGRSSPQSESWLNPISPAEFRDLQSRLDRVEVAAAAPSGGVLTDLEDPAFVQGSLVTAGLFDLLGVAPQRGRLLGPADAAPGSEPVIVVSDDFWSNRLGEDPDVVGTTVRLGDVAYRVVGVGPPGFAFRPGYGLAGAEFWRPLQWSEGVLETRHSHYLMVYGRLRQGAGLEAAADELGAVWREVVAADPGNHLDTSYETGLTAVSLRDFSVGDSRGPLLFLAAAVGLVMLIACVNVANLLLASTESRHHELAIRVALGAGRGRLVRQFVAEALVLVSAGGALGVVTAAVSVPVLLAAFPGAVPRSSEVGVDVPVLAFAVLVSVASALLLGVGASLQASLDASALRQAGRATTGRMTPLRRGMIVAEVALALMIVIGAGLVARSFQNARQVDLGFDPAGLLAVNVTTPSSSAGDGDRATAFYESLVAALQGRPEVVSAGMTELVPIRSYGNNVSGVAAVGAAERTAAYVEVRAVSPSYLDTLGVPVVRGRGFTDADAMDEAPVVVINRTLARELFGDEDPVGRRLALSREREIVGVVGDIRGFGPDREVAPYLYVPTRVVPNVVVRTREDPAAFVPLLREVVRQVDPDARVYAAETMESIVAGALGDRRFQLVLIGAFAVVALVLGAVGIYGVVAYSVEGHVREYGIRLALGARAVDIRRQVLSSSGALGALGLVLGLAGALGLRHLVADLLFEVDPTDVAVYLAVTATLGVVIVLACWIPARRASRVDPMTALRRD